jgi:hypothetical protein
LAAGSGDLANLAGWAAKLAGATCRLAALLHLARHLRNGWARPIAADTFAGAARLADYLVDHARAVFNLMGADPRVDDARWLLDWIIRTNQVQFSRRDAHQAARGRFRKATDLEPALALLEEHGWVRRVDADPAGPKGGRPPSPRFLVNRLRPNSEPSQPTEPGLPSVSRSRVAGRSCHGGCVLELYRGQHAEAAVAPLSVMEDLQVLKDRVGELHAGAPASLVEELDLHP